MVLMAGVGAGLVALELSGLRAQLGVGGILDWGILRTGLRSTSCGAPGRALQVVYGAAGMSWLVAGQVLAVAVLLLPGAAFEPLPWLVVVLTVHLLLVLRLGHGIDAGDRMLTLVLVGGVAYYLASGPLARDVALWFVGAQGMLAYTAAGWTKLVSARWRSGDALSSILSTRAFGHPRVGSALRAHPCVSRGLSWVVIAVECSAPIAVLGGVRTTLLFVGAGLLLHLGIAVVMRLNHFVWAFAATYPGMLHLAGAVDGLLGR